MSEDTSELRWWRCTAIDDNDKIHTVIVCVNTDKIYEDIYEVRCNMIRNGMRFIEAKPISEKEVLAAKKVLRLKERKKEFAGGLRGRVYKAHSYKTIATIVVIAIVLISFYVAIIF